MTVENYCMVNNSTNVCDNVVVWDGNPDTWNPPAGYTMLPQATTPAKIWVLNVETKTWELQPVDGAGSVGFTWDGTYLNTDAPQPPSPVELPPPPELPPLGS